MSLPGALSQHIVRSSGPSAAAGRGCQPLCNGVSGDQHDRNGAKASTPIDDRCDRPHAVRHPPGGTIRRAADPDERGTRPAGRAGAWGRSHIPFLEREHLVPLEERRAPLAMSSGTPRKVSRRRKVASITPRPAGHGRNADAKEAELPTAGCAASRDHPWWRMPADGQHAICRRAALLTGTRTLDSGVVSLTYGVSSAFWSWHFAEAPLVSD